MRGLVLKDTGYGGPNHPGNSSEEYSQVLSGDLHPGDQVLLEPPDELVRGGGLFRPRMMIRMSR
jgi:hypothetical protein